MTPRSSSILKAFGRRALFRSSLCVGGLMALAAAPVGLLAVLGSATAFFIVATAPWGWGGQAALVAVGVPASVDIPLAVCSWAILLAWALFDGWRSRALFANAAWSRPLRALYLFAGCGFLIGMERALFVLSNGSAPSLLPGSPLPFRSAPPIPPWRAPSATPTRWAACLSPLKNGWAIWRWSAARAPAWSLAFIWLAASVPVCFAALPFLMAESGVFWLAAKLSNLVSPGPAAAGWPASGRRSMGLLARSFAAIGVKAKGYAQGLADEAGADLSRAERAVLGDSARGAPPAPPSSPRL